MTDRAQLSSIYVLAGANRAGKSSIAGALFLAQGAEYFNPDRAAGLLLSANPGITQAEANSAAWSQGRRLLELAIAERLNFAFETTLGGHTIPALLASALSAGIEVRMWYVGLSSADDRSRLNLIQLMPGLTELRVYDNSEEADPDALATPHPKLVLHMARGKIVSSCDLAATPEWAKPILGAAMKSQR